MVLSYEGKNREIRLESTENKFPTLGNERCGHGIRSSASLSGPVPARSGELKSPVSTSAIGEEGSVSVPRDSLLSLAYPFIRRLSRNILQGCVFYCVTGVFYARSSWFLSRSFHPLGYLVTEGSAISNSGPTTIFLSAPSGVSLRCLLSRTRSQEGTQVYSISYRPAIFSSSIPASGAQAEEWICACSSG